MTLGEEAVYQYIKLLCNDENEVFFSCPKPDRHLINSVDNPEVLEIMTIEEIHDATMNLIRTGYIIQMRDRLKIVWKN